MKNLLKFLIATTLLSSILCCTNNNNKSNTILLSEEIITYNDSSNNPNYQQNIKTTQSNIWEFQTVNNVNIENYIYATTPFLIFSIDSSYVYINSGCNIYIGECKFGRDKKISFDKIQIKDEYCPIDALEREIVYMLDLTDNYSLNNNNLTLYHKQEPIGHLSIMQEYSKQ